MKRLALSCFCVCACVSLKKNHSFPSCFPSERCRVFFLLSSVHFLKLPSNRCYNSPVNRRRFSVRLKHMDYSAAFKTRRHHHICVFCASLQMSVHATLAREAVADPADFHFHAVFSRTSVAAHCSTTCRINNVASSGPSASHLLVSTKSVH